MIISKILSCCCQKEKEKEEEEEKQEKTKIIIDENHRIKIINWGLPDEESFNPINMCPYVYIGTYNDASNFNSLMKYDIKCVLNVAMETHGNLYIYKRKKIEHLQIVIEYLTNIQKLKENIENAIIFIKKCVDEKKNILVHCNNDYIRSGNAVLYYLIKYKPLKNNINTASFTSDDYIGYYNQILNKNHITSQIYIVRRLIGNIKQI